MATVQKTFWQSIKLTSGAGWTTLYSKAVKTQKQLRIPDVEFALRCTASLCYVKVLLLSGDEKSFRLGLFLAQVWSVRHSKISFFSFLFDSSCTARFSHISWCVLLCAFDAGVCMVCHDAGVGGECVHGVVLSPRASPSFLGSATSLGGIKTRLIGHKIKSN